MQILLREAYDIAYEIYDHRNGSPNRPLALVAHHPKEDYGRHSLLYRTIERYRKYEIYKHYGLSLVEFLELPRDIVEFMFETLSEEAKREAPRLQREIEALEREGGYYAHRLRR